MIWPALAAYALIAVVMVNLILIAFVFSEDRPDTSDVIVAAAFWPAFAVYLGVEAWVDLRDWWRKRK